MFQHRFKRAKRKINKVPILERVIADADEVCTDVSNFIRFTSVALHSRHTIIAMLHQKKLFGQHCRALDSIL